MRILQVIHQYPPHSSQGSEVYCHALSKELARSDDVRVFHVSNGRRRWPRRMRREEFEGIRAYHCIDGGEHARLADWPNRFLERRFRDVLAEWRPEIVHFHNYVSLGDDLVGIARSADAKVVYTLHDYGLICPNALLRRTDGRLCGKEAADYFQDCCPLLVRTAGGRTPLLARRIPSLARWRMFVNQRRHGSVTVALSQAVTLAERVLGMPQTTQVERKKRFFLDRTRKIFADTDLFLAPSAFLRDRYIQCGLPAEKIAHVRYGIRHFDRVPPRAGDGRVRFGYIGALHPHKGLELLLKAFEGLGDRAELHVHGSAFGSPLTESHWRRIWASRGNGVHFHGRYDNRRIGELFADLDVIVVPSMWYENSPLTIQEAFIAGVPVITADVGGMAELVRDNVDGRQFRCGDAADLRAKLAEVIDRPGCVAEWRQAIPMVPTIERQAGLVRDWYARLTAECP